MTLMSFACYSACLLFSLATVHTAREQEPLAPETIPAVQQHSPDASARKNVMDVAVANVLLEQGRAKEALTLYKEATQEMAQKSAEVSRISESLAGEKDWSVTELLVKQQAEPAEKKAIIDELLARGNQWLQKNAFDQAVAQFEKVFVLDPLNVRASKGIDRAKKRLIKQAHSKEVEALLEAFHEER